MSVILLLFIVIFMMYNYSENRRKCFSAKLTVCEKKCYVFLIKTVAHILEKHNIKWIPVAGNLLGVYRHGELFIPWDDDFDIVVEDRRKHDVLQILEKELPNHNMRIIYHKQWGSGLLYKICFEKDHIKCKDILHNYKFLNFNWPFVDLFLNCSIQDNRNKLDNLYNLQDNEFPLKVTVIDGIKVYYPTKGNRTYGVFKKHGYFDICKESNVFDYTIDHRYIFNTCKGPKTVYCKDIMKK